VRVLVINPPNMPFTEKGILIEPIDVLGIATYVGSLGAEVRAVDMDVKRMLPESIVKVVKEFNPDFTVIPFDYHIPLHRSQAVEGINAISAIAKGHGSRVIVVGKTPKHFQELFLRKDADVVIRGEAELALKELLGFGAAWSGKSLANVKGISYLVDGVLHTTEPRTERVDLNSLPISDRSLVDIDDYIEVRTMLTSRGCPYKCKFCATPDFWGNWTARNAKSVVDEIEYLVDRFYAKKILFLDDNATADKRRMADICNEIIRRDIKVTLGCLSTIRTYDSDTFGLMYKAGFRWVHYGVESGSQKILDEYKNGLTVESIRRVIKETKKKGFRVRASFILNLPGIDSKGLKDTTDLILDTLPNEIRLHYLSLRVGTGVFKEFAANPEKLPQQYIHQSQAVRTYGNLKETQLFSSVEHLKDELKKRNYMIIEDLKDWNDVGRLKRINPELNFASFCPARYGLNWE
jgi:radical SAM superfamily enzyme YgiQ (UPF0313 family)